MKKKNTYIISLGGSLVVPDCGIDWAFLKKFRALILKEVKRGSRFFIIIGGGNTARKYIEAADRVIKVKDDDRDWLGIHSTRLNAHLIKTTLHDIAHREIIKNPTIKMVANKKVVIAGGWKPGWSTDYVAALIAREYGVKTVINLSNIDYAYNKDPKKFPDAKKITEINWADFRKIVGNRWKPGLNTPFDPIASKIGQSLGLEVVLMNGKNLANLEKFLINGKFKGTRIKADLRT